MRRNPIYFVTIFLLAGVAFYFYLSNQKSTFRDKDKNFAVPDTSKITCIVLKKFETDLILDKEGSCWRINGEYMARQAAVDALLRVLMRLDIKAPVSRSLQEKVMEQIGARNFEITIFHGRKIIKHIRIFQDTLNNNATYMLLEGAKQPFLMQLPGCSASIGDLFIIDKNYWRDNTICKYNIRDLLWVRVDYPYKPEASFSIENTGNDFILKSLYDNNIIQDATREKILNYLFEFNQITFKELLIENIPDETKDSLLQEAPNLIITIKDVTNHIQSIKGFAIPVKNKYDELGNPIEYDLDKMYALINDDRDLVIISYFDISGVLKIVNDFF